MATAAGLNALGSIITGQGLGTSPALISQISSYKVKEPIALLANAYTNTAITPAVTSNLLAQLDTIGSALTKSHFIINTYPANVSAAYSGNIVSFTANTVVPVGDFIQQGIRIFKVTGNTFASNFAGAISAVQLAGPADVILGQAQLPFKYGLEEFANVYLNSYSYAQQIFDTVSSVTLLQNKKYSQTGIGYQGPIDSITNGIGTAGALIANVVANWGTMYDINNVNKIGDPYVFGQNLLNQGLGYINGIADQFTAAGLDISDITKTPIGSVNSTTEIGNQTTKSMVGAVDLPTLTEVTTVTVSTGVSVPVINSIYANVTGANLAAIVSATGITTTSASAQKLVSLNDYLDLSKVVDPLLYAQLKSLGVSTFADFSRYLINKINPSRFVDWESMATFLNSMEIPRLANTSATANTAILSADAISAIASQYGTGSGTFGNPVIDDYLGATAGNPYTGSFAYINSFYGSFVSSVTANLRNLNQAVIDYSNQYQIYLDSEVPESSPGAGDGTPPNPALLPSFSMITNNVSAVNSALNSVTTTPQSEQCDNLWYQMLNKLNKEVTNLQTARVTFGPGFPEQLRAFGEGIAVTASDRDETQSYQFFANIITNDRHGDNIRIAVAEYLNNLTLTQNGIETFNDAQPRLKIYQSRAQNVPLTTYLTQNK